LQRYLKVKDFDRFTVNLTYKSMLILNSLNKIYVIN